MSSLKAGDSFPEGVAFGWVPPTEDKQDIGACGVGIRYDASKEFKNKKVVLVAVPGAFTPTCQEQHVVGYIRDWEKLKGKGVEQVIFISGNDHWDISAWGKANNVHDQTIIFASDDNCAFSNSIGWANGSRPLRYALIVDNGKVVYAETDTVRGSLQNTGSEAILARL